METGAVLVREASAFDDAGKALNRAMVSGRTALQRLMREWEPTNRCKMVVVTQAPPTLASLPIPVAPPNSYDLVIMLPADVRFWVAAKTVEEDLELRLQLQCNRLARSTPVALNLQTLLEKLLPAPSKPSLRQCRSTPSCGRTNWLRCTRSSPTRSSRSSDLNTEIGFKARGQRARCGRFCAADHAARLDGLLPRRRPGNAPRARGGRIGCAQAHALADAAESAHGGALRRVAQALLETANKTLHSDVPFSNLPAEPLASLFLRQRTAGEQAHARVSFAARSLAIANPQAATLAVNAATAAYPAVLLLDDAAPPAAFEIDEQPQEAPDDVDAMSKLEKRAAALRVDYTSTTQLADSAPSVAELTQELVKLSTQVPSKLFYAPLGTARRRPAALQLRRVPCSDRCLSGRLTLAPRHLAIHLRSGASSSDDVDIALARRRALRRARGALAQPTLCGAGATGCGTGRATGRVRRRRRAKLPGRVARCKPRRGPWLRVPRGEPPVRTRSWRRRSSKRRVYRQSCGTPSALRSACAWRRARTAPRPRGSSCTFQLRRRRRGRRSQRQQRRTGARGLKFALATAIDARCNTLSRR